MTEREEFAARLRRTGPERSRAYRDGITYNIDHIGDWYTIFRDDKVMGSFASHEEAIEQLTGIAFAPEQTTAGGNHAPGNMNQRRTT